jgi:flagellar hook assembly protein FlgD
VRTIVNETRPAGVHWATWDGRRDAGGAATPGVYFARLSSDGVVDSRQIIVIE